MLLQYYNIIDKQCKSPQERENTELPSQINIKHATGEKPGNNGWRAGGGGNGGGGGAEDELLGAEKPTKQSFDLLTVKTDKTRQDITCLAFLRSRLNKFMEFGRDSAWADVGTILFNN